MKINTQPQIGDGIPNMLWESHEYGAIIKAENSHPCSLCRDESTEIHFHGSHFGMCARKVFLQLTTGNDSGFSKAAFLNDGHLHEASMLDNIQAGLGTDVKLKVFKNTEESRRDLMGFEIVAHLDAMLLIEDTAYGIECKSVKEYNFRKIREKGEISLDWYGQMQVYMLLWNLERWYLIVKHRETSQILMPIRIDRDAQYIAHRLNKLKEIHKRIMTGDKQPDREETSSKSDQCKFCSFKEQCWNGE